MNIYAYTVTINGTEYRAYAPAYRWADVCEYFDLDREHIKRGANSKLPSYAKMKLGKTTPTEVNP